MRTSDGVESSATHSRPRLDPRSYKFFTIDAFDRDRLYTCDVLLTERPGQWQWQGSSVSDTAQLLVCLPNHRAVTPVRALALRCRHSTPAAYQHQAHTFADTARFRILGACRLSPIQ
ncbi:hypothetical protein AcW1_009553 [Taiwanofungus camphoratus]|nr:hypothetical protein AcW1_009553 [Antrodia cinnamomea]